MFNAKESYKRGIKRAEDNKQHDYTHILPLFLYGDEATAQAVSGDMDIAAKKAGKAINLHSIKAKPKYKSGMTDKEKVFYDKKEFNKYMDDSYLLIGKSYVYRNEYTQAELTFNFMQTEFPNEPSLYEAQLWKAKTLIQKKEYHESGRLLEELRENEEFPDKKALKAELYATTADWYIRQEYYTQATDYLERAISLTRHKKTRMRYLYVLAQLYLHENDFFRASQNFKKVIRMSPPYEMAFNATINMAAAAGGSGADINDVKKQLQKMLRDSKNTEYHDQIYYALAEIELYEGNIDAGINYLHQSVKAATTNLPQKTKSYLTLADLRYEQKQYVPAQAYYDSAMVIMKPDYPNYTQITAKSQSLTALVKNLNTIQLQDSLQRVARMPENERNKLIDDIIVALQTKEQEQKEREAESQRLEQANLLNRRTPLADPTGRSQWYFYNPVTVAQGLTEFQLRWGRRTLEDNWRRKNKATAIGPDILSDNAEQTLAIDSTKTQQTKATDAYSREFYMQNLPLTDSMMVASSQIIQESLYNAGYIYNNDFHEYALAAAQYERIATQYPQSEYLISAYYNLYLLYTKMNDSANANKYKNLILTQAPESVFAKIINDPEYLQKMAKETTEVEQLYQQTYNMFYQDRFAEVVVSAENAIKRYPKETLVPNFAYLKALALGRLNTENTREAMRGEMKKFIAEYPQSELVKSAQQLIDFVDGVDPTMKQAEQVERAKSLYTYTTEGTYYFGWLLDSKEDVNQATFDLLNFNLDRYANARLEAPIRNNIDNTHIILVVKSFATLADAQNYYQTFVKTTDTHKNVRYAHTPFIISEANYQVLTTDKKVDDYIEFFNAEYLQKIGQ